MAGRRPRRWPGPSLELRRGAGAVLVGLCLALLAPTTWAQDRIEGDVSVQRFNPAPGLRNFITTRSARTDGEMVWTAGGFVHYGYRPFELRRCPETPGGCDAAPNVEVQEFRVVENMVTGEAVGSFTPIPELQIGGRLPVTWVRGHGTEAVEAGGLSAVGVGDLELEAKGRLLGDLESPWAAGVAAYVTAPLGTLSAGGSYIGDDTASVGARGIVDGKAGPLTWGVNLGGVWRRPAEIGDTRLGPELRYGAAIGYAVSPVVRVIGDVFGSTNFSGATAAHGTEVDGALQFTPLGLPFSITGGLGTGVQRGLGYPYLRAFVGVVFSSEVRDRDGDGIHDDLDLCPSDAEDVDGFEDDDGCPDKDNDGDGIPDAEDSCPDEPETVNGLKDYDGCPDVSDRDKDGVPDDRDQCPDDPEDTDGHDDLDGCPDPDNDGDGIPDVQDECVDEPETMNDYQDEDGCPDEAPKRRR